MKGAGVLGKAAYEKITMLHLSLKDKNKLVEPLTGNTTLPSKFNYLCQFTQNSAYPFSATFSKIG
jgi:hypothetical protein